MEKMKIYALRYVISPKRVITRIFVTFFGEQEYWGGGGWRGEILN